VNPADFTMSILWLPMSTLEVLETEEGMFDLSVTIQGTTQQIRANWKSGQGGGARYRPSLAIGASAIVSVLRSGRAESHRKIPAGSAFGNCSVTSVLDHGSMGIHHTGSHRHPRIPEPCLQSDDALPRTQRIKTRGAVNQR
jgi:hypothetical protein